MMNKKRTRTTGRIKYALFAPLAIALLLVSNIEAVARTTERIAKDVITQATTDQDGPIFMVVEQMPEFPGGMGECMKWLGANMKYPKEAKEKGEHGRVILQFVVERDGRVTNVEVKRSISPSLDAEAVRVVSAMPKWKPGMQRGKAVRVKYTMPVMFNQKGEVELKTSRPEPEADEKGIYRVADEMPEFPGGMGECFKWIGANMRYPADAHAKGITGRVIVRFTVKKDGSIADAIVVRGVDPLLDAEALRVVEAMPDWKPGKVKGKTVDCYYTLPLTFNLQ